MDTKTRLLNFIIDSFFYLFTITAIVFFTQELIPKDNARIIFIIGYFAYFFVFELAFGKTVGKMITKTRVVSEHGKAKPTVVQILTRTLIRVIPIYFLSHLFIGKGLHDYFSKTILIKS